MDDRLILVDANDSAIGAALKTRAHRQPLLHRAFSIFLYDRTPGGVRFLLQRRVPRKYHSGGLWANTCCSHPRVGENVASAARRRLREELGVELAEPLTEAGSFLYFHSFSPSLYEYEFDHVLMGPYQGALRPDPEEISELQWTERSDLEQALLTEPQKFAPWFFTAVRIVLSGL